MRASLDTNVIIHMYRANLQNVLFEVFTEEICIYEQIRKVELENHGQEILDCVDKDIADGNIKVYSDEFLKENKVYKLFEGNLKENKQLYSPQDLGEIYAISLAQTLGAYSLVTDDTKVGGPYMSLLSWIDNDIKPLNFADVLIIRYLLDKSDARQTVDDFEKINACSKLNWSFKAQIRKFETRFWNEPYNDDDGTWLEALTGKNIDAIRREMLKLMREVKI